MPPVDMPTEIHIGTRNAFKQSRQYVYLWNHTLNIFVCDQTTADGLDGEKMVIVIADSASGQWYVAVEGAMTAHGFVGRRAAFRSQEEFWSAGWHDWQVNRNNDSGEPDWDTQDGSQLSAESRVPPRTGTVALDDQLRQLALTD